jgi:hypothetical protein
LQPRRLDRAGLAQLLSTPAFASLVQAMGLVDDHLGGCAAAPAGRAGAKRIRAAVNPGRSFFDLELPRFDFGSAFGDHEHLDF